MLAWLRWWWCVPVSLEHRRVHSWWLGAHNRGQASLARRQALPLLFRRAHALQVMVVNPTIQYILYEGLVARALELRCVSCCSV